MKKEMLKFLKTIWDEPSSMNPLEIGSKIEFMSGYKQAKDILERLPKPPNVYGYFDNQSEGLSPEHESIIAEFSHARNLLKGEVEKVELCMNCSGSEPKNSKVIAKRFIDFSPETRSLPDWQKLIEQVENTKNAFLEAEEENNTAKDFVL